VPDFVRPFLVGMLHSNGAISAMKPPPGFYGLRCSADFVVFNAGSDGQLCGQLLAEKILARDAWDFLILNLVAQHV